MMLTDASLDAGGSIIALASDIGPGRFICLTEESQLGRIAANTDGSLRFSFVAMPRILQWPEGLYVLQEDIVLIAARSEAMIVNIGGDDTQEIAYFRLSNNVRNVVIVDHTYIGLLLESQSGQSEALLLRIDSGQIVWRIAIPSRADACGWDTKGIVVAHGNQLTFYKPDYPSVDVGIDLKFSWQRISIDNDIAVVGTSDGENSVATTR